MSKVRVLLAAHVGEPKGGVSTYFETLLDSGLKDCVDLHFVETSKGSLISGDRGKWTINNWINALYNISRFLLALITVKPALVHIGTAYGASFLKHGVMVFLSRMFSVPVIIQPHCSIYKVIPENREAWRKFAFFIFRQCKGVVVLSREWEILRHLLPGIKVRYIPNAIDVKRYSRLPRPRENTNGNICILYIGHITREKGIFDLVQATKKMFDNNPGFIVHIVGEGLIPTEIESIKELIVSSGLQENIKISGPEYGKKQVERFASADILVLPSYHEGMPMSIIEAMAAGLPVVASNVGGIPDLVENNITGKLIAPGDVQALSSCLIELMNDAEKRLLLGARGREKAIQNFNIEERVPTLVSFYREAIENA